MIIITSQEARQSDLLLKNYFQNIIELIQEFYDASKDEFSDFLNKHSLELKNDYEDVEDLINDVQIFLENLRLVFENDIGKFQLDFVNSLLKNQAKIDNQFVFISFDLQALSLEFKKEFRELFFKIKSSSVIDFRSFEEDLSKFYLVINRRGIIKENNFVAYKLTKKMVTLKLGQDDIKNYNFILADFIYKLALQLNDAKFGYIYTTKNTELINQISSKELLSGENTTKAKIAAKEEIKKENNLKRGSLKKESFNQIINKEATSEIRNFDNFDEAIEFYNLKELEKFEQRMKNAKEEILTCYNFITSLFEKELGIIEVLNIVKQKYSNPHTINLASILLTKDILQAKQAKEENQILKQNVQEFLEQIQDKNQALAFQEQNVTNLKLQNQKLIKDYQNQISELKKEHLQDISKFSYEVNSLKDEINNKNVDFEQILALVKQSEKELKQKENEIFMLTSQSELLKEKNALKDELILSLKSQLEHLRAQDEEIQF